MDNQNNVKKCRVFGTLKGYQMLKDKNGKDFVLLYVSLSENQEKGRYGECVQTVCGNSRFVEKYDLSQYIGKYVTVYTSADYRFANSIYTY